MYLIIDINEAPHRSQGKLEEWVIIKESPVHYGCIIWTQMCHICTDIGMFVIDLIKTKLSWGFFSKQIKKTHQKFNFSLLVDNSRVHLCNQAVCDKNTFHYQPWSMFS